MKKESIVFAVSGVFFGLIVGWILGSQQAGRSPAASAPAPAAQTAPTPAPASTAVPLNEARVQELRAAALSNAGDVRPRVELGNMYFDAEQYAEAIRWYEEAIKLNPRDPNVSTDLGVSYYYTDQPQRAVEQFEHSLSVDPTHLKTLLNMGIVQAFGLQDLQAAAASWERVVALAPESPEGRAASQAIESMRSAHPEAGGPGGSE